MREIHAQRLVSAQSRRSLSQMRTAHGAQSVYRTASITMENEAVSAFRRSQLSSASGLRHRRCPELFYDQYSVEMFDLRRQNVSGEGVTQQDGWIDSIPLRLWTLPGCQGANGIGGWIRGDPPGLVSSPTVAAGVIPLPQGAIRAPAQHRFSCAIHLSFLARFGRAGAPRPPFIDHPVR
jgi:hypothetical protein